MKNSITIEDINELIENSEVTVATAFDKVTIVTCKLPNGFVITESSGAVDKANYSEELGKNVCLERIKNKLWELEGYALTKSITTSDKESTFDLNTKTLHFGEAIRLIKQGKKVARKNWNGEGMYIFKVGINTFLTNANLTDLENPVINESIAMKTADGSVCIGWLASQADMLADDWQVV